MRIPAYFVRCRSARRLLTSTATDKEVLMTHRFTTGMALVGALALAMSWSATPASAQFGRNNRGGSGIIVYSNPKYGGESATFRTDTPDLRQYALNDKISSLEITDGSAWEICQDINYANRCQVVSGSVPN